jgi:hypothetical protein
MMDGLVLCITSGSLTRTQVMSWWNTTRIENHRMPWITRILLLVCRILIVYMAMLILSDTDSESLTGITER